MSKERSKVKAWISKFHFTIVADADTFECRLFNGVFKGSRLIPPSNSLMQYKYESEHRWINIEPTCSILLLDKTLIRIRGGIFLFSSREISQEMNLELGPNSYSLLAYSDNPQADKYKFDCCEHTFPLSAIKFWGSITLPFRDDFGGSACPVCLKKLRGHPGYEEVI